MPEHAIRFAVATADGRKSDVWKCWTNSGKGKGDVYLTSVPLGHAVKLSLHESGQWHVGFDAAKRDELFTPDQLPATRFLGQWEKPGLGTQPFVLAAQIYFPWFSPSPTPREVPKQIVWIDGAQKDQAVEVSIFLVSAEVDMVGWPGRDDGGTQLVGRLPLEGGGHVCIVHRVTSEWPRVPAPNSGSPKPFAGRTTADMLAANRGVVWGNSANGTIIFLEVPVTVTRKPQE